MDHVKRLLSPGLRQPNGVQIEVHLHSDMIIVQPREVPEELDETWDVDGHNGEYLLSGTVFVTHEPFLQVDNVRIGVIIMGSYKLPVEADGADGSLQDRVIYQQYQTYLQSDMDMNLNNNQSHLKCKITFDMMLPSSLPTWEALPGLEILPQIRISADYGYNTLSPAAITWPYPERSHIAYSAADRVSGLPDLIMEKWAGGGHVEHPRYHDTRDTALNDHHGASPFHRERQSYVRNISVNAVPSDPRTPTLALSKSGFTPGIGQWRVTYDSDMFSVGGYLRAKIEIDDLPPGCTIFAIRISLAQTCSLMSMDEFRQHGLHGKAAKLRSTSHPITRHGVIPQCKHPSSICLALWRSENYKAKPLPAVSSYRWESCQQRLPDDTVIRPTTSTGTLTPVRFLHDLRALIYFSKEGEDVKGDPITGVNKTGALRMLVISAPVELTSCICITDRMDLPGYVTEPPEKSLTTRAAICACCYPLEQLPDSGGSKDEQDIPNTTAVKM